MRQRKGFRLQLLREKVITELALALLSLSLALTGEQSTWLELYPLRVGPDEQQVALCVLSAPYLRRPSASPL